MTVLVTSGRKGPEFCELNIFLKIFLCLVSWEGSYRPQWRVSIVFIILAILFVIVFLIVFICSKYGDVQTEC